MSDENQLTTDTKASSENEMLGQESGLAVVKSYANDAEANLQDAAMQPETAAAMTGHQIWTGIHTNSKLAIVAGDPETAPIIDGDTECHGTGAALAHCASGAPSRLGANKSTRRGVRTTGKVKWFNGDKGFGFITPDGDADTDVFVNSSSISIGEPQELLAGMRVEFLLVQGHKGPQAEEVAFIGEREHDI